ncbi:PREDICTED: uncharacterized protein LOC105571038 [Vollenhovia emeryi]|uniref:uncharacterized protein LOC105571038 n=1 Tax=Vollenhovia emeryi TaxID=411798 RepID=UPI0005F41D7C|nr:PREDICTED: uncharacterized protein LOC105571038 [Vollenhovia emeryi]
MHYLTASLKGRALDCIGNLAITADNFKVAWSTLKSRFENKRRLLTSHFLSLFGLSALTKESASELQALCDKINIAEASLKNLDRSPSDLWNDFLVHLLTQKLDPASRKAWNLKTSDDDIPPTFAELNKFLSHRIRALEECSPSSSSKIQKPGSSRVNVATASATALSACPLCKSRHYLSACSKFVAQNPNQRRETTKKLKRCFNCLSASHSLQECGSKYSCRTCGKRHHSMLHTYSDSEPNASVTQAKETSTTAPPAIVEVNSLRASAPPVSRTQVLLATARVKVEGPSGRCVIARALIDQGSEATFISEGLAQTLRARRIRMPVSISAVGGNQIGAVRHAARVKFFPVGPQTPSFSTTALILPSLTSYAPKRVSERSALSHLSQLEWADSNPTSSDPIQVLIGADLYSDIILSGVLKGKPGYPIAHNSIFGWIISGPLPAETDRSSLYLSVHHCASDLSLSEDLQKFWEIEELPSSPILSPQDEQCERHFDATHSRDDGGRYIVRLPFKTPPPIDLGHSQLSADRLLRSLFRRFASQPELATEYRKFMQEYESLGHMRLASDSQNASFQAVYIPHHPVLRAESATTRLRVVFNASYPTSNGSTLNDHLLAGPKLQTELPSILLQWRQFRYVYTADIAKMFRQILIDERDLDYQRIRWQPESSERPRDYQLLTVTYGMTCAPYLALRVLRCLADDEGDRYPLAASIIRKQIYVDDVLFGDDDITSLRQRRDQLVSLLRRGKFELRKWASNSTALLEDIDPLDHGLACSKSIAIDEKVKVLGIVWNPARDIFQFKVTSDNAVPQSKREILSVIARLYDPLGWVTPATVSAKIIMQQLWRLRIDWDDPVPEDLLTRWRLLYSKLPHLNRVSLCRWTGARSESRLELHGFADASTHAYAAVVYIKTISSAGDVQISLLAGKSRVAPISPLTVPRLELSAALILSRLILFVRDSLDLHSVPCTCWTDSTIVLTWLRSHPSRWTTFVANRVAKIQSSLPDVAWRHVPTTHNPADCASRGLLGDELIAHSLWWDGPPWLASSATEWPAEPAPLSNAVPDEKKVLALHAFTAPARWDLASRFSSWPKLVRVTAYLYKFLFSCKSRKQSFGSPPLPSVALSSAGCARAKRFWVQYVQAELFFAEIQALRSGRSVAPKSSTASLSPFLDDNGVLRVGGRLRNAPLPYDVRHPVLLAPHPVVRLIISHFHEKTLHGGTQLVLSALRKEFWILRARSLVKSVIHACLPCVRERAAIPAQLMGNLPSVRVSTPSRSFAHCGVDYAGPLNVRASAGRGIKSLKAYVALFICLSSRAIHLELVGDYSTAAFLSAFNRFCSRRGLPQSMFSDNGTTFVGADRELASAYRSALQDPAFLNHTANDNIAWHFIPPSAPHFGGLWEAGVKSVKHHLHRVLGSHTLSFEEMTTLLCQIEACLNSRPIAPLSDSFDDYQFLTPGHFLIGQSIAVAPEPSILDLQENRLSRWQMVRQISERFWKLWSDDYVNTLQQRSKWRKPMPAVVTGKLVLLRNPLLPPCKWELGRIIRLHPGPDGLTRVVTVRTAASEYVRPIGKICILPVDASKDCVG